MSTVTPTVPTSFFIASESEMETAMVRQDARRTSFSDSHNGPPSKDKEKNSTKQGQAEHAESSGFSGRTSIFGVQSLEQAISAAFGSSVPEDKQGSLSRCGSAKNRSSDGSVEGGKKRKRSSPAARQGGLDAKDGTHTPKHDRCSSHSSPQPQQAVAPSNSRRLSPTLTSNPLTPICIDSPAYHAGSGIPSTPKSVSLHSLKLSDDGEPGEEEMNDAASQAIASTDDEDDAKLEHTQHSSSAPELVMPSIAMPARRPFTENGKRLGRLKIMVVGAEGVGKTGLIRSIVQICEDIVHVDPAPFPVPGHFRKDTDAKYVTETHASTRAYPPWWSDMEESKVLRRRKSMGLGDSVLERNVCFVDTPGLNEDVTTAGKSAQYIKSQLHLNSAFGVFRDAEVLNLLGAGGSPQVDVVLYVFGHGEITQQEVSSFSRLATLANVIPLIGKSDMLDRPGIITLKRHILEKLQDSDAKPFLFGSTIDSSLTLAYNEGLKGDLPAPQSQSQAAEHTAETSNNISSETSNNEVTEPIAFFPYLISSAPGPDLDTMDASLLMSSDYCPPPVPSELHRLVQLLFDPEKAAWLRHTAARKFIAWRREKTNSIEIDRQNPFKLGDVAGYTTEGANLFASSTAGGLTPNLGLRSLAQRNASGAMSPRSIVPRWAASLTKALRNEREREGKTAWNDEGAGAPDLELQDSGLDLDLLSRKDSKEKRKLSKLSRKSTRHWSDAITPRASQTLKKHERDPLDVLSAVEKVSSVAWTAVKVIGAVSAAGAVACFVARRFFGVESITVHWQW